MIINDFFLKWLMDLGSIIVAGLQALSSGFQSYKGVKEMVNDIQKSIEKKRSPESNWSAYINPHERFKISWPSQRWAMREIGPILPTLSYVNIPVQLRFRLNPEPTMIPALGIGLFHNLTVTVDLHGEVEMHHYVKTSLEGIVRAFESMGAKFYEEKSAHKVDVDNATLAGRIIFASGTSNEAADTGTKAGNPEQVVWKIITIQRFKERVYSLTGTIIESAGMDEIASKDLMDIMKAFVILEQ